MKILQHQIHITDARRMSWFADWRILQNRVWNEWRLYNGEKGTRQTWKIRFTFRASHNKIKFENSKPFSYALPTSGSAAAVNLYRSITTAASASATSKEYFTICHHRTIPFHCTRMPAHAIEQSEWRAVRHVDWWQWWVMTDSNGNRTTHNSLHGK